MEWFFAPRRTRDPDSIHAAPNGAWMISGVGDSINMALLTELFRVAIASAQSLPPFCALSGKSSQLANIFGYCIAEKEQRRATSALFASLRLKVARLNLQPRPPLLWLFCALLR